MIQQMYGWMLGHNVTRGLTKRTIPYHIKTIKEDVHKNDDTSESIKKKQSSDYVTTSSK